MLFPVLIIDNNSDMSKKSRGDKGEKAVIKLLKKEKNYHKVINDAIFITEKSEMTHQIDHILIHPHGVFVIETKNYYGEIISNTGDSFWLKIVRGETSKISNPLIQNKSHTKIIKKIVGKEIEVIPVVVFVKNNAPFMGDDNVINLKDLLLFIFSYPYQRILEKDEINKIYKLIKENTSDVSNKEHVQNISYLKQINSELRAEKEYAIERRTCPRCGGKIIERDLAFSCSKCDFKFKL